MTEKETKKTAADAKAEAQAKPEKKAPAKPQKAVAKSKAKGSAAGKPDAAKAKKPAAKAKPAAKKSTEVKAPAEGKTAPKAAKARPKAEAKPVRRGPRLKQAYFERVLGELQTKAGYKNMWQVPRLEKIVLNIGLGNAREDRNSLKGALDDLAVITGQKAVVTYAKMPISNFKIRAKDPVGVKVTLRRNQMWEFFDRLMSLAIPRVRDFRGLPNRSFDGRGNYSFGLTEQIVFPEIDYDKIDKIRGMDITLVTTAKTDEESYDLLTAFGFPFRPRPQAPPEGATE